MKYWSYYTGKSSREGVSVVIPSDIIFSKKSKKSHFRILICQNYEDSLKMIDRIGQRPLFIIKKLLSDTRPPLRGSWYILFITIINLCIWGESTGLHTIWTIKTRHNEKIGYSAKWIKNESKKTFLFYKYPLKM